MTGAPMPAFKPRQLASLKLTEELKIAEQLALEAGALLRSRQSTREEVRFKVNAEIVTAADIASNEIICRGLLAAFPGDAICSEEAPEFADGSTNRTWIVDPLDSTSNYVEGGDEYSVSIGLAIAGQAVLGVVYSPARDELFSGHRGIGARWNRIPVRAAFAASSQQPRLLVSSKEWKRGLNNVVKITTVQPMASMAYKLARVAAGRNDACISFKRRKPWGTCAGTALVLAAGGQVTSLDGEPLVFGCSGSCTFRGMVAAGNQLHDRFLKLACDIDRSMRARYPA